MNRVIRLRPSGYEQREAISRVGAPRHTDRYAFGTPSRISPRGARNVAPGDFYHGLFCRLVLMDLPALPIRTERFEHIGHHVEVVLPLSPEDLIDVSDFNVDERLPYWADLWPSARALAVHLLECAELPESVIELGCGVALPSLALRSRGIDPLATDWYEEALHYAELNARRNALDPLRTMQLEWRKIPEQLKGTFTLAIAADVLYELR